MELLPFSNRIILAVREDLGPNSIELCKEYLGDQLIFILRYLKDEEGKILCREDRNLNTNEIDYTETEKYYYLESDLEKIYASYNDDGSLKRIIYKPEGDTNEQNWELFDQDNFSELQDKFIDDISYYLNATLEP